jgi:hypothetical protein
MINFATDKNFGLVDIDQRRLPGYSLIGRKQEASCAIIPTVRGISLSGLGLNEFYGVFR